MHVLTAASLVGRIEELGVCVWKKGLSFLATLGDFDVIVEAS